MLEILPYVNSRGWKPEWRIRTKNYGEQPECNIFPSIIRTSYEPEPGGEVVSFERLEALHRHNFRHDFRTASALWNAAFQFTDDVRARLDQFRQENFPGEMVLGVHYRGTDKNADTYQTNPVSHYQFPCVVEDFLRTHPDVNSIFVASDDEHFVEAMSGHPKVRFHAQARSRGGQPAWNDQKVKNKQAMAKDAILDALCLSRCRYVLKCMSQLSAFSKVLNPEIDVYRVSACKTGWFPEAYIPLCESQNKAVKALLRVLQDGDSSAPLHVKAAGMHKRVGRIVAQSWRRRDRLTSLEAWRSVLGR